MADPKQFFIVTSLNDLALDVYQGGVSAGDKVTTYVKRYENNENQLWYVDLATSTIRSVKSNLCLAINGQDRLVIDNYNAGNESQNLEICGSIIRKRNSYMKVLEVVNGNTNYGAEVTIGDYVKDTPKQVWTFELVTPSSGSGKRAPSVWLRQDDTNKKGDIITIDGMVPSYGLAMCTYYSMINWNAGQEGGGYLGIQDHPGGKNFIFSIWDSKASSSAVEAPFLGPGTQVENFGGEGTGLKSWNFTLGWEPDKWMTFITRCWQADNKSLFGFWVKKHDVNRWYHLVNMKYPVHDIEFNAGTTGSFVEDWIGNGELYRAAQYKNTYKRDSSTGNWIAMTKSTYSAILETGTADHNTEYSGGSLTTDQLYLATGGLTNPGRNLNPKGTNVNVALEPSPSAPLIDFTISSATGNKVSWVLDETSTPQFSYRVVNQTTGQEVTGIDSEVRKAEMPLSAGNNIEVFLEDIFGRQKSLTKIVN